MLSQLALFRAIVLSSFALVSSAHSIHAQILQQWTQQSVADDPRIKGESSAVVAMDASYMFVADNEHEALRLYTRFPSGYCVPPVYSFNARPFLNLSSRNPECDIEAAVMVNTHDTNRIFWLASHSNSTSGKVRTNRHRLFATRIIGDGSGSPPYSLEYIGRYEHLRTDLILWDKTNLHGKGANYYRLEDGAASGVTSEDVGGFNMEGLCIGPDGTSAYLAFRTPLVNGSGATTSNSQRTNALIIPLKNISELVAGNPVSGPGKAKFGTPFTLNLGGRGIRSIDSSHPGHYLITAGPTGQTDAPSANFRLFTWTGDPSDAPVEHLTTFPKSFDPEGAILPAMPIATNTIVQFVSDDSAGCWRSFTAYVGVANASTPDAATPTAGSVATNNPTLQPR